MDLFFEKQKLLKLNQVEIDILNRPITIKEIEFVNAKTPNKKSLGPDDVTGEFHQTFKQEGTSIVHSVFQKLEEKDMLSSPCCKASITLISNPDKTVPKRGKKEEKENYRPIAHMN